MENLIFETLNEFATRRNNENINNYNAGYEQALLDILEMIEADASYDEVYESIGEYLNEGGKFGSDAEVNTSLKRMGGKYYPYDDEYNVHDRINFKGRQEQAIKSKLTKGLNPVRNMNSTMLKIKHSKI